MPSVIRWIAGQPLLLGLSERHSVPVAAAHAPVNGLNGGDFIIIENDLLDALSHTIDCAGPKAAPTDIAREYLESTLFRWIGIKGLHEHGLFNMYTTDGGKTSLDTASHRFFTNDSWPLSRMKVLECKTSSPWSWAGT